MNEQTGKRNAHKHSSRSSLTVCVVFGLGRHWRETKWKSPANSSIARMYEPVREDFVDSKKSQEREREILRRLNIISITFCLDNNRWSIHRVKASVTVSPRIQRLRLSRRLLLRPVCSRAFFFYLSFFTLAYKQMRGPTFYFPPDFRHTLCIHTHCSELHTHTHTGYELVRVDRGGHTSRRGTCPDVVLLCFYYAPKNPVVVGSS